MLNQDELKKVSINTAFTLIKAFEKIRDNDFIEDLICIIRDGDLSELNTFSHMIKEKTKK